MKHGIAQQAPDAGRLLEQLRPAPQAPAGKAPRIELAPEATPQTRDSGTRIHVSRLHIVGATQFSEAELHALIGDGEGRELTLTELRGLAERLTRHYRERGFPLARAYIPAQDVQRGEVVIRVLEGRVGRVMLDNAAGLGGAALAPLSRVRPGEAAEERTLEQSLLLLSDLPGTELRSTLRPGATIGTADLLVSVAPGPRLTGSVDFDTYGDRFSGQNRLGGMLNWNNPLRLGDQAALRAVNSDEGMRYLRASYQLPVDAAGTRFGIAQSDMRYRLAASLEPLHASGAARTRGLYLLRPLIRGRGLNLNLQLQYDDVNLDDRIARTATRVDKSLERWTAGVGGNLHGSLGNDSDDSFSLAYSSGRLHLDRVSRAIDAASARSAGDYAKWSTSWTHLQRLDDAASLLLSASMQRASKNLDSSEKLILGGATGVRAYPQGEAPGDEGALLTLELRRTVEVPWPGLWQLAGFVDGGHVRLNKRPWTPADDARTLSGAGIGLNGIGTDGWTIRASLAWRLSGRHSESDTDRSPRPWLQVVRLF